MAGQSAAALRKQLEASQTTRQMLSWGRYPKIAHAHVYKPAWNDQVPAILQDVAPGSLLPFGLGRSYGDSCLNAGRELIACRRLNRILGFDETTGMIRCESGVTLSDIIDVFLPKGWFLPVTPGTRFVTVGGAIANDVHGKNHHRAGTLGAHVRQIGLHRSNDGLAACNAEVNSDMLRATIGGLGLTGVIAWADIQLKPVAGPWMEAESVPFQSLEQFLELNRESNDRFEYTVAWLDCFAGKNARGIFFRGNHAADQGKEFHSKRGLKLPMALPAWMLNRYSVKAFNSAYYRIHAAKKNASVVAYDSFFYPLDSIRQWNLLYGKQGFLQYQCVIPETNIGAIEELLDRIARSGMGSFLGVLKQFGSAPPSGMLSFPRPGLTIALDFAMRGERTLKLMQSLDEIVLQSGGALYPAKDARMSPALFEASFPRWREFVPYIDPKISSSFWRRVTGAQ
ncbi:MAG TPA: FAD-binding oxidoreductase [Terriglobales bacterium]|jgi:FAD/FMN-containing dehydrogenase|nr:FAD-binding oxidoreductase [Terriglobales bacterium]